MRLLSAPLISREEICPGTILLWLQAPDIAAEARPGQYVMARCGNLTLRRPFSIHRRKGGRLALLFAVKGRGTLWLSQLSKGDTLDLLGPLGNGFTVEPEPGKLLLVAGGLGIAPLAFLAQQGTAGGHSVTLLHGAATASQLYPETLLPAGVEVIPATEDGSRGRKGMVTDILPELISEPYQRPSQKRSSNPDTSGFKTKPSPPPSPGPCLKCHSRECGNPEERGIAVPGGDTNAAVLRQDSSPGEGDTRPALSLPKGGQVLKQGQQVFACGPAAMYQAIAQRFPKIRAQVSLELRLGCGLGACLSCSIQTRSGRKKACQDGPVFNLQDVIWSEVRV